ncbi:MAG: CBS domain-containing protein [Hyphomicrobiales bacterium]
MTVHHILAEKGFHVEMIGSEATLDDAVQVLGLKRIGAVPVVDPDGALRGILSERDILRAMMRGPEALGDSVLTHMTADFTYCSPETPLVEVMDAMTNGRFRHMPVLNETELCGIVSIGDVVKQRLAEIEAETDAMRTYIATA